MAISSSTAPGLPDYSSGSARLCNRTALLVRHFPSLPARFRYSLVANLRARVVIRLLDCLCVGHERFRRARPFALGQGGPLLTFLVTLALTRPRWQRGSAVAHGLRSQALSRIVGRRNPATAGMERAVRIDVSERPGGFAAAVGRGGGLSSRTRRALSTGGGLGTGTAATPQLVVTFGSPANSRPAYSGLSRLPSLTGS